MNDQSHRITLLGSSGFIGGHLCHHLVAKGYQVRVLTRSQKGHKNLAEIAKIPGIELIEGDPYEVEFLAKAFAEQDVVINIVGILNESGHDGHGFYRAHVELPEKVVQACHDAGVPRLLHMSALNADAEKGASHYMRSKGAGEDLVHRAASTGLAVTTFRPSVVYGPGDSFSNRFARLLRFTPLMFPLACPETRFAPIFVEDVVAAFTRAIDNPQTHGQRYELCGPQSYSLRQLVKYIAHLIGVRRLIIPLNDPLSRLQANIMEYVPGKPFSLDNYLTTRMDSVCGGDFPAIFGIEPGSIEEEMPRYLKR